MKTTSEFTLACRELLDKVLRGEIQDPEQLVQAKKQVCKDHKLSSLPTNADIIISGNEEEQLLVRDFLRKKPVRTISGVAVVAAMTSPAPCPHGTCVPCPGGPDSSFASPQSYMGQEPSTMRAIQCAYDPYKITAARLEQLKQIGHDIGKAELIIMGGTYSARSLDYQEWYVKRCLEAMNDFYGTGWRDNVEVIGKELPYIPLEEVQKANETAKVRNVGITFETRPDWTKEGHVDVLLKLGATKVEIGVQSTYDFVLSRINRGHSVSDTIEANRVLRDSALKVGFHMMPHLPGMDTEGDIRNFERLFKDTRFMPDYLKIYPTLVTEGTELHRMWKNGEYEALTDENAVELLSRIKSFLPKWVRLQRIQRDIPAYQILAGTRKSNIRQLAKSMLEEHGGSCRCIRCREVGHNILNGKEPDPENIKLVVEKYDCCGGVEHFISFEDVRSDILIGFLRLRFPYDPHRLELQNSALVRELHVYGSMVPVGETAKKYDWQHRGYGAELLACAEELAKDAGFEKISIISGIGVREYYRKQGYVLDGVYMSKWIQILFLTMHANQPWTTMRSDQIEKMSEKEILGKILELLVHIDKNLDRLVPKGIPMAHIQPMKAEDNILPCGLDIMTLLSLPEHLRTTAKTLFDRGPSTAEEISNITHKERAVESGYLNQLVRMKHVKKYREGRKVYFCINHDSGND